MGSSKSLWFPLSNDVFIFLINTSWILVKFIFDTSFSLDQGWIHPGACDFSEKSKQKSFLNFSENFRNLSKHNHATLFDFCWIFFSKKLSWRRFACFFVACAAHDLSWRFRSPGVAFPRRFDASTGCTHRLLWLAEEWVLSKNTFTGY